MSVGLPTYNRAGSLRRAIDSVLAQEYPLLELVISDNASTDETREMCEDLARADPRVRYVRQPENRGPVANFQAALEHATGELFMWLADDDWLDPGYVGECARVLVERPDFTLVGGIGMHGRSGEAQQREEVLNLTAERPAERVREYYRRVAANGIFYGVMRRAAIARVPLSRMLAADWLVVASLAFQGKVGTVTGVAVHREVRGASWQGIDQLAAAFGLSGLSRWNPYVHIARLAARDIWESPVYEPLSRAQRLRLALQVYGIIQRRYGLRVVLSKLRRRLGVPDRVARRLREAAFR